MDLPPDICLIVGTGIEEWAPAGEAIAFETPYGRVVATATTAEGRRLLLFRRHEAGHSVPPHGVNYRALIWAIGKSGATSVVGTAAVGAVRQDLLPGRMVVLDDLIDFTHGRAATFLETGRPVRHLDVTHVYCRRLSSALGQALLAIGEKHEPGIVYAATNGPRFETPAEIRALRTLGADVVGMTQAPEAFLAKERGLCYAAVAVVANPAASRVEGGVVDESDIAATLAKSAAAFGRLLATFLKGLRPQVSPCTQCGGNQPIFPFED